MARRYGAMGTFGAAEIGNAIAHNPAVIERLYQEFDRRNLIGDHQRLSSAWNYANHLSPAAARAAAGVALLIGHADGETLRRVDGQTDKAAVLAPARASGIGASAITTRRVSSPPPIR
ncbi:MAG: hypothetical protein WAM94_17175 [Chromatiaceae bacterium]